LTVTAKPVVPRELARHDIEEAVDFSAREAGERVAARFIDGWDCAAAP
jgi:toxin ParE1/3/4